MNHDEVIYQIYNKPSVRRNLTYESHVWFFHLYLNHFVKYKTAPFQLEMLSITENDDINFAVIVAFRGSAKSTIMSLSYPIWAVLGKPQKKFVVISSQTQEQSRLILSNIKDELEKNDLLVSDFGPFIDTSDEWRAGTLVIPEYDARIKAISTGESIRGIRHREHRPDLIILDDVESTDSVRSKEGRDKMYTWLTGDVIPAGDTHTKYIIIGNLLHEDSLIMRMKNSFEEGSSTGMFRAYPLVDNNDQHLWEDKFPSPTEIDVLRKKIGNHISWQREYMLKIVPDVDRVVHREWLHRYTELPIDKKPWSIATGVDLAISQKSSADYTAIVSAKVYGSGDNLKIYILPNPINKRLTFPETIETLESLSTSLGNGQRTQLFIESTAYQAAAIQELQRKGFRAEEFKSAGNDKRSRLALTTHLIQSGTILFPDKGADSLVAQLVGFGVEKHDDLADAFSILILKIQEQCSKQTGGVMIDLGSSLFTGIGHMEPISLYRRF